MRDIDLHTHSTFSDGTRTPAELIAEAEQIGLAALALTDHNTVAGLPSFMEAAAGSSVQAVGGAEFSTDYGDSEVHIVALFLTPEHYDDVRKYVLPLAQRKQESNAALAGALQQAGYPIYLEEIAAQKPKDGQINRADFAAELQRKGCMDFETAFATVLSKKNGLYREPRRLDAMETIEFIRSVGAVPVLAHPYLSLPAEQVETFVQQAVGRGLGGMEVYYPTFDPPTVNLARQIAAKYGLAESGGSDFHGGRKPDIHLGSGRGSLHVPAEWLEKLRAA